MKLPIKIHFLAIVFILLSIFYLLPSATLAQATSPQVNPYISPNTNPDVPNNLHNWTQNAMIEVMSALSCQLSGIDPTNPNQQCLGVDQKTGKIGFVENGGGAIGVMDKLITMTFTMPIHTGDYISYLSQNFGITKQAYAQGVGFQQLSPFLPIWVAFRNLVYLLFILVFVVIGMFIMLRVQFDPRTVMTVQNQIPKLIIGIILVTFSFAIAGLMIDAMYIVIYFVYGVALTIPGANLGNINLSTIQGQSAISALSNNMDLSGVTNTIALSFSGGIKDLLRLGSISQRPLDFLPVLQPVLGVGNVALGIGINGISVASALVNFISSAAGFWTYWNVTHTPNATNIPVVDLASFFAKNGLGIGGAGATYGIAQGVLREFLPWAIPYAVIMIAIFAALFKLWFELIKAYTFILFDIVLAPFWIISSLTPGNPAGFSLWLRAVLSNLAVFPTTIVMFLLGKLFIEAFKNKAIPPGDFFVPPLIGNAATPDLISAIVGITVILTTPAVVSMVKNAFKAPNFPLATAGRMFGVGMNVSGETVKQTAGTVYAGIAGTMPTATEKGTPAILRRLFGRL